MFFVASKIFWLLVQPISLLLILMLVALVSMLRNWRKTAVGTLAMAALLLFTLGFTSLGYVMIQPLENRFAVPATPPQQVAAIVMLGGATMGRISAARSVSEMNQAADRLTTTLWLAQHYPSARIVLSGGTGLLGGDDESEAATVQRFMLQMGIAEGRLVVEDKSRNTAENAAFTRSALVGQEGAIILVTSAFHMPRSVGLFRAEGVDVVPWPTDYRSTGRDAFGLDIANLMQNFDTAGIAIREWTGLLTYFATGRIADILPAMETAPVGAVSSSD